MSNAVAILPLPEAPAASEPAAVPAARVRRRPRSDVRIANEPAFVLHSYPYKETSLIIDALTRHHGRVALVARGAKRPRSALRGILLAFQPLTLGWSGGRPRALTHDRSGGDLRTLTKAEWMGGVRPLRGDALLSGFYLNELVLKLLARDDAHEALFDAYLAAVTALAEQRPLAAILRAFEVALLREAGYALRLARTADGDAVDSSLRYRYVAEHGAVPVKDIAQREKCADRAPRAHRASEGQFAGKTLLDIEAGDYSDPATLTEAKLLMRHLLQHHLAGQALHTRQIMIDLQNL